MKSRRARVDGNRVLCACQVAEGFFEIDGVLAHAQNGRVDDVDDSLTVCVVQVRGGHGDFVLGHGCLP